MFLCTGLKILRPKFLIPVVLFVSAWQVQAVQWTLTSAGPPTWTYTLTFDPLDNYNLFQNPTTITVSGLSGVTAAGAPTSTDFTGALNTNNLAWTAQVLNGGTEVVWTNSIGGTGNFAVAKHVFGFSITAPAALNGTVSFATSGMAKDTGTANSIDISGSVSGPSATGTTTSVPAASPLTLVLLSLGLAAAGAWQVKRRIYNTMLPRE